MLTGTELTVIAAAVLGGTSLFGGSGVVVKSVIGALILFTLSNGFNVLNIGSNYQNVVQGCVLSRQRRSTQRRRLEVADIYGAAGSTCGTRTSHRSPLLPMSLRCSPKQ